MTIPWTDNLENDWSLLCGLWKQSPHVLQSEVGPRWKMPPHHKVCVEFADHYPDSKEFLIAQLADRDPRIAAYAFKCLVRVARIQKSEISNDVIARAEKITTVMHSFIDETTLGQFIGHYFDTYSSQDDLLVEQEQSISWQENELAEYERRSGNDASAKVG
jgi:hypothetical protein